LQPRTSTVTWQSTCTIAQDREDRRGHRDLKDHKVRMDRKGPKGCKDLKVHRGIRVRRDHRAIPDLSVRKDPRGLRVRKASGSDATYSP
jgi:hypothetical protein